MTNDIMVVVAAALIAGDGRTLVQQRPQGKSHAGLWEFPGGKVEPGESPAAALVRELSEELGIGVAIDDLVPVSFAAVDGARPIVLLLFRSARWQGEPAALEAAALRWIRPEDCAALPMPPADYPLAAALAGR